MNDDYRMSPLGAVLLSILRWGSCGAAALLVLFAGILLYQRRTSSGAIELQQGDLAFLGVLGALLILAVYLVRGIASELRKPGE